MWHRLGVEVIERKKSGAAHEVLLLALNAKFSEYKDDFE